MGLTNLDYAAGPELGFTGQVADLSIASIETRINESATPIDFGVAVARGVGVALGKAGNCKPVADGEQILGITVKNPMELVASADGLNTINYARYAAVPVMKIGRILALAVEDVREGDAVLAIVAEGGKLASPKGGVAGSGRILVPNAVWETTTVAGKVGRIFITGGETGRLTT